jgi:transcriptional regulator with XRE-family HTH domain
VDARIFGEELRKHCQRFGSISAVCEGAGINRQQFNKYLCGQMLPSARSMRKICGFLGVSEEQLFTGRGVAEQPAQPPRAAAEPAGPYMGSNELITLLATQRLSQLTGGAVTSGAGAIPEGYYYCYFPLHSSTTLLVRTLISVRQHSEGLLFTRRTYFSGLEGNRRLIAGGMHRGVILAGRVEAFLLGVNRLPPHQLSYLSISLETLIHKNFRTGLVVTSKNKGQIATNAAVQYLGQDCNKRQVLKALGAVCLDDATVDPVIRLMMTTKTVSGINQIHSLDMDGVLRDRAPIRSTTKNDARVAS